MNNLSKCISVFLIIILPINKSEAEISLLPFGTTPSLDNDNLDGSWMVCGLRNEQSYLSLRESPSSLSPEILKLSLFSIVNSIGVIDSNKDWIKLDSVSIEVNPSGRILDESMSISYDVNGWISTRYICHYGPFGHDDPV